MDDNSHLRIVNIGYWPFARVLVGQTNSFISPPLYVSTEATDMDSLTYQ